MKKLIVFALMCVGLTTMAAIQYSMENVSDGYIISVNNVTDGDGRLLLGGQGGGGDNYGNYTVGWYKYTEGVTPTRDDVTWASVTNHVDGYGNPTVYLGNFEAGDKIGLYFVRNDEVNGVQEAATTGDWDDLVSRQASNDITNSGNPVPHWQFYWSDMMFDGIPAEGVIQENHFLRYVTMPYGTFETVYGPVIVGDQMTPPGGSGSPSGQPLPGVLACLLLGGGLAGYKKMKKARQS